MATREKRRSGLSDLMSGSALCAVVAALAACLATYLSISYVYDRVTAGELVLPEFIAGYCVWKDYYKPQDFLIPRLIILFFILYFFLFSFFLYLYQKQKEKNENIEIYGIVWCFFLLARWYFGKLKPMDVLLFFAYLAVCFFWRLRGKAQKREYRIWTKAKIENSITVSVLSYFALRALLQVYMNITGRQIGEVSLKKQCLLLCVVLALGIGNSLLGCNVISYLSQFALCLFPLSLWSFHLIYNGDVQHRSYSRLRVTVVVLCLLLLLSFVRSIKRKKQIALSSFLVLGAMQLYNAYSIDMFQPVNMFHQGEMSVPMQQLWMYGKLPFFDIFPIHGFCDYFFQAWNYLLFDGSYAAWSDACYFGGLLLCACIACIYRKTIRSDMAAVLMTVLFTTMGEWYYYLRFFFVIPAYLLMFSTRIRKDVFRSTGTYAVLCMVMVLWYPSVGGAFALSLLPVAVCRILNSRGRRQLGWLRYRRMRMGVARAYTFPVVLLFLFLPFLPGIFRYLVENMGISGYFPGDRFTAVYSGMVSANPFALSDPTQQLLFRILCFLLPIVLLSASAFVSKRNRALRGLWVSMLLFSFLVVSYTFGSVANGERSLIVALVFFVGIAGVCLGNKTDKDDKNVTICLLTAVCVFMALALDTNDRLLDQEKSVDMQEIPDWFVPIDGDNIGMPGLGKSYTTPQLAQQLNDFAYVIHQVCSCQEDTFLDLTDQGALMLLSGRRLITPYISLYHASCDRAQEHALESIRKQSPKLVLVSPRWENDGGSAALKNKEIYQYLCDHYVPYRYGDICFMLKKGTPVPKWAQDGADAFYLAVNPISLQRLPAVWARIDKEEAALRQVPLETEIVSLNHIKQEGNKICITGEDPYLVIGIKEAEKMQEAEYMRLSLQLDSSEGQIPEEMQIQLYFSATSSGFDEVYKLNFDAESGELLVPLYAVPVWAQRKWEYLRLDIENWNESASEFTLQFHFEKQER